MFPLKMLMREEIVLETISSLIDRRFHNFFLVLVSGHSNRPVLIVEMGVVYGCFHCLISFQASWEPGFKSFQITEWSYIRVIIRHPDEERMKLIDQCLRCRSTDRKVTMIERCGTCQDACCSSRYGALSYELLVVILK